MKLDPRIQNIRDVLTPFDDGSTLLTGEYCAFANDIETFKNLDECTFGTLNRFSGDENFPFEFEVTVSHRTGTAKFCLPYCRVKKTWRPFTLEEFLEKFKIQNVTTYRHKNSIAEYGYIFSGYFSGEIAIVAIADDGTIKITIGDNCTLKNLFDEFEFLENDDWKPFGVKE